MDFVRMVRDFERSMKTLSKICVTDTKNIEKLNKECEEIASDFLGDHITSTWVNDNEAMDFDMSQHIKKQIKNLKRERKHAPFLRQQQIDREISELKRR